MARAFLINIIVNCYCTRSLLYATLLKETETEETIVFCDIFIIGSISIGGGPGPLTPPGYVYAGSLLCSVFAHVYNMQCAVKLLHLPNQLNSSRLDQFNMDQLSNVYNNFILLTSFLLFLKSLFKSKLKSQNRNTVFRLASVRFKVDLILPLFLAFIHDLTRIFFKSNLLLYSLYYAEACKGLAGLISASLRPRNTASFEEMSQREQATICLIWPFKNLNLRPSAPETNALPLDQLKETINAFNR